MNAIHLTRSSLFNLAVGIVFGLATGTFAAMKLSEPAIAHAQEAVDDQAKAIEQQKQLIQRQAETIELRDTAVANLTRALQAAQANPAAALLAQSGHVMNEAQCRAWIGVLAPPAISNGYASGGGVSTVLYESGKASLNISLLPLPGAPRVSISPNSQLAPRWIIPGKIAPQMVGETRKAVYYYFDGESAQWQGPFAPERVAR